MTVYMMPDYSIGFFFLREPVGRSSAVISFCAGTGTAGHNEKLDKLVRQNRQHPNMERRVSVLSRFQKIKIRTKKPPETVIPSGLYYLAKRVW